MQGLKRKLVFITTYEIIGWIISSLGLALLSGNSAGVTGPLALVITTIAVSWNFIFNTLFEFWESRQASRIRTFRRRLVHAVLFQLTLVVFLIPLIAWWLSVSLIQAFLLDFALIIFIPIYTFFFNWAFDKLFGVPASALPREETATHQ
ncbi:PACE efflux transporter [Morganella morganii]|uniref:PACE efflux transporter n=1 Tax=Morganella morganii TaxID=582 RepID=UPI001C423FC2|nr:PACE efflux transporter [Morganella morganii]ELA9088244.1 PACE efflux transporter [Morganella morganii]MCU6376459.1 PACE efflux transporter [Morganella morganii]HBH7052619.1 PACE efflux transporter [Morganella morganii]HEI9845173.1 PACE efflux transporter [Morganella morganii]